MKSKSQRRSVLQKDNRSGSQFTKSAIDGGQDITKAVNKPPPLN